MQIASAFLSHSWHDKSEIVHPVAEALGRRGIIPWEDQFELIPAQNIRVHIRKALNENQVMVLFLSAAALQSGGVTEEIRIALKLADELGRQDAIIPVFLGKRDELVQNHPLLRNRWLLPSGKDVNILGIEVPDPSADGVADTIADGVAWNIYNRMKFRTADEIVLILDQRGDGPRTGSYQLPPNIQEMEVPKLVFRSNMKNRKQHELCAGKDWESYSNQVNSSLSKAIGNLREGPERTIHILGHFQESLGFMIGQYFNRTTQTTVFTHSPRMALPFSNMGWPRHEIPVAEGANPAVINEVIEQAGKVNKAALFIGRNDYRGDVVEFLEDNGQLPLIAFEFDSFFDRSEQVFEFLTPIFTCLKTMRQEKRLKQVQLFSNLPVTVSILLATYLTQHLVRVDFMERDHEHDTYRLVPMPDV